MTRPIRAPAASPTAMAEIRSDNSALSPSLAQYTWAFFVIGVTGFGGVLPWARRVLVEQRQWLTPQQFNDLLALCQFLPGPNIINMSVVLGSRLHGPLGAAAGLLALMGAPVAIALALGWIYVNFGHAGAVDAILRGVAPVAAGLMLATGIKVAMAYSWRNRLSVFALLSFVAIALFRVSLPVMLLALVPAALLLAWHRLRGARATG